MEKENIYSSYLSDRFWQSKHWTSTSWILHGKQIAALGAVGLERGQQGKVLEHLRLGEVEQMRKGQICHPVQVERREALDAVDEPHGMTVGQMDWMDSLEQIHICKS